MRTRFALITLWKYWIKLSLWRIFHEMNNNTRSWNGTKYTHYFFPPVHWWTIFLYYDIWFFVWCLSSCEIYINLHFTLNQQLSILMTQSIHLRNSSFQYENVKDIYSFRDWQKRGWKYICMYVHFCTLEHICLVKAWLAP